MAEITFARPSAPSAAIPNFPDGCTVITVSDTDTYNPAVAVYASTAGTVVFTPANGGSNVTVVVPAGGWLPCRARAVLSTGTTGGITLHAVY